MAVVLGSWIPNNSMAYSAIESLKNGCRLITVLVAEVGSMLRVASLPTVYPLRYTNAAYSSPHPYSLGNYNWTISVVLTFSVVEKEAVAVMIAPIVPESEIEKSGIVLGVLAVMGTVQ